MSSTDLTEFNKSIQDQRDAVTVLQIPNGTSIRHLRRFPNLQEVHGQVFVDQDNLVKPTVHYHELYFRGDCFEGEMGRQVPDKVTIDNVTELIIFESGPDGEVGLSITPVETKKQRYEQVQEYFPYCTCFRPTRVVLPADPRIIAAALVLPTLKTISLRQNDRDMLQPFSSLDHLLGNRVYGNVEELPLIVRPELLIRAMSTFPNLRQIFVTMPENVTADIQTLVQEVSTTPSSEKFQELEEKIKILREQQKITEYISACRRKYPHVQIKEIREASPASGNKDYDDLKKGLNKIIDMMFPNK